MIRFKFLILRYLQLYIELAPCDEKKNEPFWKQMKGV